MTDVKATPESLTTSKPAHLDPDFPYYFYFLGQTHFRPLETHGLENLGKVTLLSLRWLIRKEE